MDLSEENITDSDIKEKLIHYEKCKGINGNEVNLKINRLKQVPNLRQFEADLISQGKQSEFNKLDLSCNAVKEIVVNHLPLKLTELYLHSNKIKTFPDISSLKLSVLDIGANQIAVIPGAHLPRKLKILCIDNNKLTSLTDMSTLTQLEFLDAKCNQLKIILAKDLPLNVKKLYLGENKITKVESLVRLKFLQQLELDRNKISVLEGFPESLSKITLAGNQIVQVKQGCLSSGHLYDVLKKKFTGQGFGKGDKATKLQMPPADIFKLGYNEVVKYFQENKSQGNTDNLTNQTSAFAGLVLSGSSKVCQGKSTYQEICMKFRDTLGIHEKWFDSGHDKCFCQSCHNDRGDNPVYDRGEPEMSYALPVGWYRFGLACPPKVYQLDALSKWHRGYHGTKPHCIRKILEIGDIVPAGMKVLGGDKVSERNGHFTDDYKPDGFNTKQVFVSPSIVYAGLDAYATPERFIDPQTNEEYSTQVALQILINPDSYDIGPETVGADMQIDPLFNNSGLEWSTDQHGAVIIYGLLIKMGTC